MSQQPQRIGEILCRIAPLSHHDIEEILSEQLITGKRFGDIALELGLCRPEHIWRAWSLQLIHNPQPIDLDRFGIDAQAIAHVTSDVARQFQIIPIRAFGDELVVAHHSAGVVDASDVLPAVAAKKIMFVTAPCDQVHRAIEQYYPTADAA
jgi:type IV pilus assembly protein PilB